MKIKNQQIMKWKNFLFIINSMTIILKNNFKNQNRKSQISGHIGDYSNCLKEVQTNNVSCLVTTSFGFVL
jgi:hypothetical protein